MKEPVTLVGKVADQSRWEQGKAAQEKKLRQACADFEAIFVYQLMQSMRKTVPKGGLLPVSAGRSTYEMMMDQFISEAISRRGDGLGLQKVLYNDLKKKLKYLETPPINITKE